MIVSSRVTKWHLQWSGAYYDEQNHLFSICNCMHLNDNYHVYPKKVITIPSFNEKLPVTNFHCLDRLNLSQYDNAFQNFRVSFFTHAQCGALTFPEPLLKCFFMHFANPNFKGNFIKSTWLYITNVYVHYGSVELTSWIPWKLSTL